MKKVIVIIAVFVSTIAFAQNKNEKATIEVNGVCMMCKERIEKACFKSKGVKSAIWDVNTHELKLIYDARKTNLKTIQQNIADVGHDTQDIKATDEAYNSVDPCCLYRDKQVVDDHKN
ncbi:MAG: cation transporter [Gelidibacter sp.]